MPAILLVALRRAAGAGWEWDTLSTAAGAPIGAVLSDRSHLSVFVPHPFEEAPDTSLRRHG